MMHQEHQYLHLIRDILNHGTREECRNGPVRCIFGHMSRYSLRYGQLPLLTTKRIAWKTCFRELMWFLSGKTDNQSLTAQNVHIWDGNSTREFLDSRGLTHREEGDLGPIYGHQWRHFNAPYETSSTDYTGQGVDQISWVINEIKTNPTSRRLIVSAWNPQQLDEMALPPCHIMMQFFVKEGRYLSCALTQRSGDVGLGIPFNIASYSFLTHLIAHQCGLEADEFIHYIGYAHIYESHVAPLQEQLSREPKSFPRIRISGEIKDAIESYTVDDIEFLTPYEHHPSIRMDMVA